jgi:uncharacterized protein YjdB
MKKYLSALAVLALLFMGDSCTPEDSNSGSEENGGKRAVHVTGVSLDRSNVTIKEGESVTLVATVKPDKAENKNVSWSSSDASVASVNNSGNVTGVKAGSTTITATTEDGGKTSSCVVSVEPSTALSVTVGVDNVSAVSVVLKGKANLGNTSSSDLKVGFQYSKSAGILPSNSITVEVKDADANYNYTTTITGLEPETIYYFRSFVRQNGQDTYGETKSFTTKDIVSLLETKNASDIETTSATLNAKLDLTDISYRSITYGFYWGTSESNQDKFLSGGDIADNAYAATMGGLSSGKMYWYKAYVKLDSQVFHGEVRSFTTVVLVGSVSFDKTSLSLIAGDEYTLTATVNPDNADNKTLKWTSSEESVATVDKSGKVKAKSKGTAVIKAEAQDGSGTFASCKVVVKELFVFSAVDLGLSVKWANANMGAGSEEDYGDYYAWGETRTKSNYHWGTYKWKNGALTKYCSNSFYGQGFTDTKTVLDLEDDVAHVNLGGNWRMPTDAEWTELRENCVWTWTNDYYGTGVSGQIVTSKKTGYENKSIFLPAAGLRDSAELNCANSFGYYWSSSLYTDNPELAWDVDFGSGFVSRGRGYRDFGLSVRPVYGEFISVEHVSLNKTSLSMNVGDTQALTATVTPSNATDKSVTWSSSKTSVASVSSSGVVTAKAAGSATITVWASDGVHFATCNVTVLVPVPDAVDLGLPSGVKWASFNLGASKPEEYGDYYAWGETEPKSDYGWSTYKWCMGSNDTMTKYCTNSSDGYNGFTDTKTVLDLEDDAAHVTLGGKWRIPTDAEWTELRENCAWTWTKDYYGTGVSGQIVTSKKTGYENKSIFLPAAGQWYESNLSSAGSSGYYWSSSLNTDYPVDAWLVLFGSGFVRRDYFIRRYGYSVRPVTE